MPSSAPEALSGVLYLGVWIRMSRHSGNQSLPFWRVNHGEPELQVFVPELGRELEVTLSESSRSNRKLNQEAMSLRHVNCW